MRGSSRVFAVRASCVMMHPHALMCLFGLSSTTSFSSLCSPSSLLSSCPSSCPSTSSSTTRWTNSLCTLANEDLGTRHSYRVRPSHSGTIIYYFQLDKTRSWIFHTHTGDDCRILSCVTSRFWDSCWTKRQLGTTWIFQRSRNVWHAQDAWDTIDQFVCYKATTKRSRSRQSTESVDSSRTFLAFTI